MASENIYSNISSHKALRQNLIMSLANKEFNEVFGVQIYQLFNTHPSGHCNVRGFALTIRKEC